MYEIARDLIREYCEDNNRETSEETLRLSSLKLTVLSALVESAFQLGWYEEAIAFAQEGIDTNPNMARLHHMLAKSILALSDALNKNQSTS